MPLVKAGTCIYLPDADSEKTRLHVVLNDAWAPPGKPPGFAVVSLSSSVDTDRTTILNAGEHDYVDKETYVVYPWIKWKDAAKLEAEIATDMSKRHHHSCSPELLKRIHDGVFESPHTKENVYKFCRLALNRTDVPSWEEVNPE